MRLLAESDFVKRARSAAAETRGCNLKFYRMKPTAFLINTARGR